MRFIKILSFFLAAVFVFSGCKATTVTPPVTEVVVPTEPSEPEVPAEEEPFTLRIPFDFDEGVSPYKTLSKPNRFVCELIYRSIPKFIRKITPYGIFILMKALLFRTERNLPHTTCVIHYSRL